MPFALPMVALAWLTSVADPSVFFCQNRNSCRRTCVSCVALQCDPRSFSLVSRRNFSSALRLALPESKGHNAV